jgi:hypothetical protein
MWNKLLLLRIFPALILCLSGCDRTAPSGQNPATPAPEKRLPLAVYPDSETSANPRLPCVPAVAAEGGGSHLDAEAVFRYTLAPLVTFPKGGELAAEVRDNGRRESKDIISLADGTAKLVLRTTPAHQDRLPLLVYSKAGKEVASATLKKPLPRKWTPVQIKWDEKEASLSVPGEESVSLALPDPIHPQSITLQTAMVDNLKIDGEGRFSLDWGNGYAAGVEPAEGSTDVVSRVFGFDAYVIGQDSAKRDFPMLQVLSGSTGPRDVTYHFGLRGEVTGLSQQWSQKVTVPGRSGVMVPVELPSPLKSDVYHMAIRSDEAAFTAKKNFLFAGKRDEPKGPAKFGLHDSDRQTFGFWPDTLPIDFCHLYTHWGYVHGPMWAKDPGITAETPQDEWAWDPRIDRAISQGLTPWVGLISRPFYDWMRDREFPPPARMDVREWGTLGGFPNLTRYRKFVKVLAERYKGHVPYYEVENEPMAYLGGTPAQDYAEIAKAVYEEVHAVDPGAKVYGISGTGDFIPWMREVFAAGGDKGMDGVSIHTYVTPAMPEAANLAGKIAEVNKIIASTGKPMPLFNSETGTYVALREVVDRPISPERLGELIKQATPPFYVPSGWPNHAVDEWSGSSSMVRNAITNFLGGAQGYIFFGWNDKWPKPEWWGEPTESCFALISASKDGEHTPSLHTLAIAVLTEQLKGARQLEGKAIDEGGILGGIFPKVDGGEVAVLWSPLGKRSALVESADSPMEIVSLFGQPQSVPEGKCLVRVDVVPEPVYIHTRKPGLHLLPSPVIAVSRDANSGFQFTLVNKYKQPWNGSIRFANAQGWTVTPSEQAFDLEPGARAKIQAACTIPTGTKRGSYAVEASLNLPDGTPFAFPVSIAVRPTFVVPPAPSGFAWDDPSAWKEMPLALKLDQSDQVTVGRAPLLASLQEEQYWKGPNELSGEAKLAADGKDLFVYLEVKDANQRAPKEWPGVLGSSVEVFLDLRAADSGLSSPAYGPGVHQIVLKAPTTGTPELWEASAKFGRLEGVSAAGAASGNGTYWVALRIPRAPNNPGKSESFGFDIGINGPPAKGNGRKTQIMLFGTASNNSDASGFGAASIQK